MDRSTESGTNVKRKGSLTARETPGSENGRSAWDVQRVPAEPVPFYRPPSSLPLKAEVVVEFHLMNQDRLSMG